jgi:hypothetical protein
MHPVFNSYIFFRKWRTFSLPNLVIIGYQERYTEKGFQISGLLHYA